MPFSKLVDRMQWDEHAAKDIRECMIHLRDCGTSPGAVVNALLASAVAVASASGIDKGELVRVLQALLDLACETEAQLDAAEDAVRSRARKGTGN